MEKIAYIFFKILIIFIFYDGILNNSIFSILKNIKYLILFLLLIVALIKNCSPKFRIFNVGIILFFYYHIIIGIISIPEFTIEGIEGLRMYKQYFLLPVFMFLFYNFNKITHVPFNQLYLFLIKTCVIYIFVNAFLYFIEFPIWTEFRPWWGRITQGYPTVDVVSLSFALLVLFYEDLHISICKRVFYTLTIIAGIVSISSGTGLVLLFVLLSSTVFIALFIKKQSFLIQRKSLFYSISFIPCIFFMILTLLKNNDNELYEQMFIVVESKISILLNKELDNKNMHTMEIRADEYKAVEEKHLRSITDKLFGVGFGKVNYNSDEINDHHFIYVEDQYSFNKVTGGWISNFFFLLFLFLAFWNIINNSKLYFVSKIFGGLSVVIFALSSFSSIPLGAFSIMASFSIIYSSILHYPSKKQFNS